jgi:hypothetical protein
MGNPDRDKNKDKEQPEAPKFPQIQPPAEDDDGWYGKTVAGDDGTGIDTSFLFLQKPEEQVPPEPEEQGELPLSAYFPDVSPLPAAVKLPGSNFPTEELDLPVEDPVSAVTNAQRIELAKRLMIEQGLGKLFSDDKKDEDEEGDEIDFIRRDVPADPDAALRALLKQDEKKKNA